MRVDSADILPGRELAEIQSVAMTTTAEVVRLLPTVKPDFLLWVRLGADVIAETGEVGVSVAPGLIEWVVDPTAPGGIVEVARHRLRATLFHELHHQARGWVLRGGAPGRITLVDAAIAEGLATVFARDEAGDRAPWADYPDEVEEWVIDLRHQPETVNRRQWMYRHPDGRRWIAYKAGTYIVDQAIERSGSSAAALVHDSAEHIVALADLDSRKGKDADEAQ